MAVEQEYKERSMFSLLLPIIILILIYFLLISLIALRQEDIKHQLWTMLCLSLGLRRGEAIGLQWKYIDFTKKTLNI